MRSRIGYIALGLTVGVLFDAGIALAWTGPSASAPNSNVGAPVNVGTTAQVKNGDLGANNISAFGNALMSGLGVGTGRYINFDFTSGGTSGTGSSGYGIRDNAGTLEFKNTGGSWQSLQTIISGFAGFWTSASGGITYTGGFVGIGPPTPGFPLDVMRYSNTTGYKDIARFGETNSADGSSYSHIRMFQTGTNAMGIEAADQSNTKGSLGVNPYGGNVGIGTISPGLKLDVVSTVADGASMRIRGIRTGAWGAGNILFGDDVNASRYQMSLRGTNESNNGNWHFYYYTTTPDAWAATMSIYPTALNATTYTMGFHNDQVAIGTTGNITAPAFLYSSDVRLKKNVAALDTGLVQLMQLRPVSFTWNEKSKQAGENDIGFIAQDVEKIVSGIVHTDEKGMKSIDYVKLTPILVKAVQEQQEQIASQAKDLSSLRSEFEAYKAAHK